MLEESINELTKAVLALTYAMNQSHATPSPIAASLEDITPAVKEPKAKKPTTTAHTVDAPEPTTTTDTSPSSEPKSAPVSYDDVKKATNSLSAAKGRDVTIAVLARFGVQRATNLDEAQWIEYIAHAGKVTEGADV
jgi:hypothetical protein